MGFSVFLALLVHGILLFGIGISQLEPNVQPAYVTLRAGFVWRFINPAKLRLRRHSAKIRTALQRQRQSLEQEKVSPATTVTITRGKPTQR